MSARSRVAPTGSLLLGTGDEEDPTARVPDAEGANEPGHGAAERAELVRRLGLVAHEAADVAEIAEQALRPRRDEVVGAHVDDLEVGAPQKPLHLGARIAKLGEAEAAAAPLPDLPQGHEHGVHDVAAEGVVEWHHDEEQAVRLEHPVNLAEK